VFRINIKLLSNPVTELKFRENDSHFRSIVLKTMDRSQVLVDRTLSYVAPLFFSFFFKDVSPNSKTNTLHKEKNPFFITDT
jgi:hypothetical protein